MLFYDHWFHDVFKEKEKDFGEIEKKNKKPRYSQKNFYIRIA